MKNSKYENDIKKSNYNIVMMNKSNLNKLSKSQLIDELLKNHQNQLLNLVLNLKNLWQLHVVVLKKW